MSGKKLSALFFNLVAPGVGHWALGAKRRGAMYMAFAGLCCFWAFARVGSVFVERLFHPSTEASTWRRLLENARDIGVAFGWPILLLIVLWGVNYVDLFFTPVRGAESADAASGKREGDGIGGGGAGE